jgi:hypothetical protein
MKGLHQGPRFRQLWLKNRKRGPNSVGQEKRPGHADVRDAEIAKGLTLHEREVDFLALPWPLVVDELGGACLSVLPLCCTPLLSFQTSDDVGPLKRPIETRL